MIKKSKKRICILLTLCCMLLIAVPVYADTVKFDITSGTDPLSKKIVKAGGSKYEPMFYVGTDGQSNFNKNGALYCKSIRYQHPEIYSNEAIIQRYNTGSIFSAWNTYRRTPPANVYYYMTTRSNVSNLHVTGRYTP